MRLFRKPHVFRLVSVLVYYTARPARVVGASCAIFVEIGSLNYHPPCYVPCLFSESIAAYVAVSVLSRCSWPK